MINWIFIAAIVIILLSAWISLRLLARKRRLVNESVSLSIPDIIPEEGMDVPLLNSFAGIRGLGSATFIQNTINPRLALFNDRVELRVIYPRKAFFSDIRRVAGVSQPYFNRMRFEFKDRIITITVEPGSQSAYQELARFLESKGVQVETKN